MALCQRCHAAAGDGFGIIQPNLANFPRAFANNAPFFRRASDKRIMTSLSEGIPGTSMPPYGQLLSNPERNDLVDLVSSFVGVNRMEKEALQPLPARPFDAPSPDKGETLFRKHCVRCHGNVGTGTGPEYLKYLPKPRNLRNAPFFAGIENDRVARSVYDGVPGTAMHAFRDKIKPNGLWQIVEKVRQFSGTGERGGKIMNRREFLHKGLTLGCLGTTFAAFGSVLLDVWLAAGKKFTPAHWQDVASLSSSVSAGVVPFPGKRVAIIARNHQIAAMNLECTHLGCIVTGGDQGFFCPCHRVNSDHWVRFTLVRPQSL